MKHVYLSYESRACIQTVEGWDCCYGERLFATGSQLGAERVCGDTLILPGNAVFEERQVGGEERETRQGSDTDVFIENKASRYNTHKWEDNG